MTTTHPATNLRSADDLWRLPEDRQRHELVRGEVTTMALAGGEHGDLAATILVLLGNHVRANHLSKVLAAETVLAWVVNPRNKSVTVHRTGRDPRILRRDDTLSGEEACPGFCIKVSDIFAD